MIVVGLTGGIASGKSFVSGYLKELKIPTHESDAVISLLYEKPTKDFLNFLKTKGFEKTLFKNTINKNQIRKEIFTNSLKRKRLEGFLHGEVKKNRDVFLKKNKNKKIIFLDIPLLFEKKLDKICDFVCSLMAPIKKRKERAMQRPNMKKNIIDKIIRIQVGDVVRRRKSNYLIDTSKTKEETCLQVDNIIYDILEKSK